MKPIESGTNQADKLWSAYRKQVYHASEPLVQMQERECSLAFYAGMEAAFWRLADLAEEYSDIDKAAEAAEAFRQGIIAAATQANLDRSDGQS